MGEATSLEKKTQVHRQTPALGMAVCAGLMLWASFVVGQLHAATMPPRSEVSAVVQEAPGLPLVATSEEAAAPGECESELAKLPK